MASAERSQASLLVELAESVELFTTPLGEAYGRIPVGGHWETWPLRAKVFRHWLARCFYQCYGHTAHSQAMLDALATIEGHALYDSDVAEVHVRIGADGDVLYLDLADDGWRAVQISRDGWQVVADSTVRFRRSAGMLPLPEPVRGGDLERLQANVNVGDDDWQLLVAWLIGALRPVGPYPVLCLHGEQGSAKSTTAALLRALIDPNEAMLRAEPRDGRDLMIAARNCWIIALDNLSRLPDWLSDALCRLATRGGYATRTLYTDVDETIVSAQRPILLNGIEELATRGDLLDRAIVCYLPRIENYRPEEELWQRFEEARPAILGGLLDAVVCALQHEHDVRLEHVPRMADFARWVTAAEPELGWQPGSFLASCSPALHRVAPHLRPFGIEIEFKQTLKRSRRGIRIRKPPNPASQASQETDDGAAAPDARDAATLATHQSDRFRPGSSDTPAGHVSRATDGTSGRPGRPVVIGDDGYLELLDRALAGGFVTGRERRQRRLLHLAIRRAEAA